MDFRRIEILNPKRDTRSKGRAAWFPYYAGFSQEFAAKLLQSLALGPDTMMLDSWNGSGTTTAAAAGQGVPCIGIDLNPVMIVVARARLLGKRVRPSLDPIARAIVSELNRRSVETRNDPLGQWFSSHTVISLRKIEAAMQELLCGLSVRKSHATWGSFDYSDLTAFYYLALFRLVRRMLRPFCGSNPTWIKAPANPKDRLSISRQDLCGDFLAEVAAMAEMMPLDPYDRDSRIDLQVGSSSRLPLPDSSVDLVLSSPPYCTRIDYAIATLPELAVLGHRIEDLPGLRKDLIGTPTIFTQAPLVEESWGTSCAQFLDRLKQHPSKASAGYYYKNHCQYFDGIFRSLQEISRVLKQNGGCALIVQDSWYKDLRNDLPQIVADMSHNLNLRLDHRADFSATRNMARVNPGTRNYRVACDATESVLCFSKN